MLYPEFEFVLITDYTFNLTLIFALFCKNFFLYRATALIPFVCMFLFCLFCTYFFFSFTDPGCIFLFAFFLCCSAKLSSTVTVTSLLFPLTFPSKKMLSIASK